VVDRVTLIVSDYFGFYPEVISGHSHFNYLICIFAVPRRSILTVKPHWPILTASFRLRNLVCSTMTRHLTKVLDRGL
jgi:hypothetical protein